MDFKNILVESVEGGVGIVTMNRPKVEAEEAARIGLLNKVVASNQLVDAAVEMGRQIAKNVPACVQDAKALLNGDIGRSWQAMQQAEDEVTTQRTPSPVEVGFAEFLSRKGRT